MQAFRTIVTPPKAPFSVSHNDRIVSIGSCFSENVGRYFQQYKFDIGINPFGQQYNPASIANAINRLISAKPYLETELVHQDELYHSFDHHGSFSRSTEDETLEHINDALASASEKLRKANMLFLTFGTAHVFKLKDTEKMVSNCHKIPGSQFDFALMSAEEIVNILSESLEAVWRINPNLQIVLTVSPVRYFAFGQFENSVSKGHLFSAINMLIKEYPKLYYFPAYEIVMDDLRDYRFFKDDMLHPSPQAIAYVWEKLSEVLFSSETKEIKKELDEITAAVNHRPRNPQSEGHQKFKDKCLSKMKALGEKYGFDLSEEMSKLM